MHDFNSLPKYVTADAFIAMTDPGTYFVATSAAAVTITMPDRSGRNNAQIAPHQNVYRIVLLPTAKGPGTVRAFVGSPDTFLYGGGTAPTSFALMPGEAVNIADDGAFWVPMFESSTTRYARVVTDSGIATVLDKRGSVWECTATAAATWTLPPLADNRGLDYTIKNVGTAALTVQRAGTDQIHDAGAPVSSVTIAVGAARRIVAGGTYWLTIT